jgi:hypothetical protein
MTGSSVTNYHVVFDDWFATVFSSDEQLPDFGSDRWKKLLGDSEFQYTQEEDDTKSQLLEVPDQDIATRYAIRSAEITAAMDNNPQLRNLQAPITVGSSSFGTRTTS